MTTAVLLPSLPEIQDQLDCNHLAIAIIYTTLSLSKVTPPA
jgi:hypothetical protein